MSQRVYRLGITNERGHPEIDFSKNPQVEWYRVGAMLDGEEPLDAGWFRGMDILVATRRRFDVLRLDYRFIVSPAVRRCFEGIGLDEVEYVQTKVNGGDFFHLRVRRRLDCLDRELSELRFFPGTHTVMSFKRCALRKDLIPDPALFCLPESDTRFFATESVEQAVSKATIVGFRFIDCDNPPAGEAAF